MTKLFWVLFWVGFSFWFHFATPSDFKAFPSELCASSGAGVGWPSRDFSISSLQTFLLDGGRAASASKGQTWDSANFPFWFQFREESKTVIKKEERLSLHVKPAVSKSRQRNLDGKGNKRSALYLRFTFARVSHLMYMIGHRSWRNHRPLFLKHQNGKASGSSKVCCCFVQRFVLAGSFSHILLRLLSGAITVNHGDTLREEITQQDHQYHEGHHKTKIISVGNVSIQSSYGSR